MSEINQSAEIGIKNSAPEKPALPLSDLRFLRLTLAAGITALGVNTADVLADEKRADIPLSAEQTQTIEKLTGLPYAEIGRKFRVEFQVEPDQHGKYFIHFGQEHQHSDPKQRAENQDQLISVQQEIEGILLPTIEANNLTCVFTEGVTDEQFNHDLRDKLQKGRIFIEESMKKPINTPMELTSQVVAFRNYYNEINNPYVFHYLGTGLDELREKMIKDIESGSVKSDNLVEGSLIEMSEGLLRDSGASLKQNTEGERPNPYTMGAAFKIFMEGRVPTVCPVEGAIGIETRQVGKALEFMDTEYMILAAKISAEKMEIDPDFKRSVEIANALEAEKKHNWTNEERIRYERAAQNIRDLIDKDERLKPKKQSIERLKERHFELKTIEREREGIRMASAHNGNGSNPVNIAFMYGVSHDFTNALNEYNNNNLPGDIDRGLIKLSPKKQQ